MKKYVSLFLTQREMTGQNQRKFLLHPTNKNCWYSLFLCINNLEFVDSINNLQFINMRLLKIALFNKKKTKT